MWLIFGVADADVWRSLASDHVSAFHGGLGIGDDASKSVLVCFLHALLDMRVAARDGFHEPSASFMFRVLVARDVLCFYVLSFV